MMLMNGPVLNNYEEKVNDLAEILLRCLSNFTLLEVSLNMSPIVLFFCKSQLQN